MDKVAIVVIAYNRAESLLRLLDSISEAYYPKGVDIPLIISVDKSDSEAVANIAREYVWEHGYKSVRLYETNLGLREHVLSCGDIACEYDGAILLEDDLYVSPSFYMYTLAALTRTRMVGRIGGISLYNHLFNVHSREPFEAIYDGYDNYYLQMASSWGQAFSGEQWESFRKWYEVYKEEEIGADNVPENVSSWSAKSWLKYYIKYLIDTDRYFLYPRISFTTNFADEGEHMKKGTGICDLQVPIAGLNRYGQIDFRFSDLDESMAIYDAYFENLCLEHRLPQAVRGQVSIDLYGTKQSGGYKRYVLSSRPLPYRMLESYGRRMRPIDANVVYKPEGRDFFLYDTTKPGKAPKVKKVDKYLYNYRALKAKEMLSVLSFRIFEKSPFAGKKKKPVRTVAAADKKVKSVGENSIEKPLLPGDDHKEDMQALEYSGPMSEEMLSEEMLSDEMMPEEMLSEMKMQPGEEMMYEARMQAGEEIIYEARMQAGEEMYSRTDMQMNEEMIDYK
ncbi:MAG: hypothetical protein K6E98_04095 [Lachnospiraceae bacterium]|nr:hypothetical protein [Lachnospiraceae bacterium]